MLLENKDDILKFKKYPKIQLIWKLIKLKNIAYDFAQQHLDEHGYGEVYTVDIESLGWGNCKAKDLMLALRELNN